MRLIRAEDLLSTDRAVDTTGWITFDGEVVSYEPDNGTRYEVFFGVSDDGRFIAIGASKIGAYVFHEDTIREGEFDYFVVKMRMEKNRTDALALFALLLIVALGEVTDYIRELFRKIRCGEAA